MGNLSVLFLQGILVQLFEVGKIFPGQFFDDVRLPESIGVWIFRGVCVYTCLPQHSRPWESFEHPGTRREHPR